MSQTTRSVVVERDGLGTETTTEVIDQAQDSVELSINAKGEPSWTVKAYGKNAAEIEERLVKLRGIAEDHARVARMIAKKGASE